jgi:PAS domain S-box-containing protein
MSKPSVRALHEVPKHKRAPEALREAGERFRSAFSYAAIGMALVGTDGRWLQVNRSLCEIVGYSEQELLSRPFQDITHPDDLEPERFVGRIEELLRERRVVTGEELTLADGRVFERDYIPIFVGDDDYRGHLWHYRDITKRKRAEEALKESEERYRALMEQSVETIYLYDAKKASASWSPTAPFRP